MNTNWKELIQHEMKKHKETFDDVVSSTLTEEELLKEFDDGYGCSEGTPFTLWTHKRTYFPGVYDGREWCASVSRNPDEKPTSHIGGE
jgi:hypothetical protein